jgi:hypothetical protein
VTLAPLRQREPTSSVLSDRVLEAYFNQPPARRSTSVSPLTARLVLACLATVMAAVVAGLFVLDTEPAGPAHPGEWDPRVAPYAAAVERSRGEDFLQPVYVDFLTDAAFASRLSADPPQLAAAGEGQETLGYYSFDHERIRLRGETLSPLVASVLVGELAHALQDQLFGVGLHLDLLSGDDEALVAFRAVVAADARRVEAGWRDTLDKDARTALNSAEATAGAGTHSALSEVGQAMVSAAYRTRGNVAVDDLLRRPPTTQEHLLDPWTLVEDRQVAIPVRQPGLPPSGGEPVAEGTFGAIDWLVLLGERLPARQALGAALGWGGDSYRLFSRHHGRTCLRINYTGDTPGDTREMQTALQAWIATAPAQGSRVSGKGSLVRFETCGASPPAVQPASAGPSPAVRLALTQTHLTARLIEAGLWPRQARCGAEHLVQTLTLPELDGLRLQGPRAQRLVARCVPA